MAFSALLPFSVPGSLVEDLSDIPGYQAHQDGGIPATPALVLAQLTTGNCPGINTP